MQVISPLSSENAMLQLLEIWTQKNFSVSALLSLLKQRNSPPPPQKSTLQFFPCDLSVFGEHHKSAEHAYHLTKSLRCNNPSVAQKAREAETALDAKRIGQTVTDLAYRVE